MGASVVPGLANELQQQQQQVQNEMQNQQEKKAVAEQQVETISDQLRKVQIDLAEAQSEYKEVQTQLAITEQQIKVNTEILATAGKRIAEREKILNKRIRDIYQNGQLSYLDVLLGANDFSDFVTRVDILHRVIHNDLELILKIKAERQLVLDTKAALDDDRATILGLKQGIETKKQRIEKIQKEQEGLLKKFTHERDAAEKIYKELMATSLQIEQMIRRNQSSRRGSGGTGPSSGSGSLMWPTEVREITSPFGWRTHPIYGTSRYHSGIDIGADYGDAVVAADGGVVISAGWMGGYGKAVIIDHGGNISTLYGHNSELLVSAGQRVGKGEIIARVGSTGDSTGPHCHFEVRQDGAPVSPLNYLP